MRNGRAGGTSGVCAKQLKMWLKGVIEEEEKDTGNMGYQWCVFVKFIHAIWVRGEVLQ